MIEALWAVYFVAPNIGDYGAGVVVLENGTVRGGDSSYYYVGDFRVKDETLTANVSINHYAGPLNNIFGPVKQINVALSGNVSYEEFTLTGSSIETSQPVFVKFKRIAEISA
jgi:T3SS negative regulator,GrlR